MKRVLISDGYTIHTLLAKMTDCKERMQKDTTFVVSFCGLKILISEILDIINEKNPIKFPKITIDKYAKNMIIYILLLAKKSDICRGGRVGLWHQS